MSFRRLHPALLVLPVLASLGGAACASSEEESAPQASEDNLSGSAVLSLGAIAPGETRPAAYTRTPKWRAFSFNASKGDKADFWVRSSTGGDAEAFIVTSQYATLASNTSADGVMKDAHVTTTIPKTGYYYIVFRDSDAKATSFNVEYVKAAVVADAGVDSGPGSDGGPPPIMSNDPFDASSCLGAPLTVAQATAMAADGDSFEHSLKPNRLGRYELKTRTRSCFQGSCGPWAPVTNARFQGGYLGLGYAGDGFDLQGDVRIDTEGGLRVRVVDASVDSSTMYYPMSVAIQLTGSAGNVGFKAGNDYQFGAPDLNNGRNSYVYGRKDAVWSTIVMTSTCLRMMSTEAEERGNPNIHTQYAFVARF